MFIVIRVHENDCILVVKAFTMPLPQTHFAMQSAPILPLRQHFVQDDILCHFPESRRLATTLAKFFYL